MERVHLMPSDDEDIYSGFNDYNPITSTTDLETDVGFQTALKSSHGHGTHRPTNTALPPGTAFRLGTSGWSSGMGTALRPMTMATDANRPTTAVKGVGYTSSGRNNIIDPRSAAPSKSARPFDRPTESMEEKLKALERKVSALVEESCMAGARADRKTALDKAKEASTKERSLIKQREQAGLTEGHNLDLTFSVLFNLASQYTLSEMYSEALSTYQSLVKNRLFSGAGRLRLNMGNIYVKLGDYSQAIKQYRMALDQVPSTHQDLRIKIMHNIGMLFVKMGQFTDACTSFEFIMQEKPDFRTGLDLIVSYYALAEKEKLKQWFLSLLEIPLELDDNDKYTIHQDDPQSVLLAEAIRNDALHKLERQLKQEAERCILMAAKLISPVIEATSAAGFQWCVEAIKASNYAWLADDLEVNKAVLFLRQKNLALALETLKTFEKRDSKVASAAAANLSAVYFLQGDYELAEKYAGMSRDSDAYNPAAFVSLGNCSFLKGEHIKARDYYICALESDVACPEALYNLGLTHRKLGQREEALDSFLKLHNMLRHQPEVLYQIALLQQEADELEQAIEWYLQLLGLVPTDAGVLQKIGDLFDRLGDRQQAFQYYSEAFRYLPGNMDTLTWLGAYYLELQLPEKAVVFFEKAAFVQPQNVQWGLQTATCYRKCGQYPKALQQYISLHRQFPDSIETLRALVRLCTDLGLKEASEYANELRRLEQGESRRGSSRLGIVRSASQGSRNSSAASRKGVAFLESTEEYDAPKSREIDTSYSDPLGPLAERPRTSSGHRRIEEQDEEEELGEDLLPL